MLTLIRYIFVSVIIISTITGVIFVSLLDNNNANDLSLILETDFSNLNYIHKNVELRIDFIKNDVLLISQNDDLINYVTTGNNNSYTVFSNFILLHIKSLQIYDQIKFINITGYEKLRINFNGSNQYSYIVSQNNLQNQFNTAYFNQTLNLNQGELYVSTVDLTRNNGIIKVPFTPVIRFGTPVFDSLGSERGIIIVDYLVSDLFNQFSLINKRNNQKEFSLLDYQGNYLLSENSSKEWGNILHTNINFANENPTLWNEINIEKNSSIHTGNSFVQFYTFSVFDSRYFTLINASFTWFAIITYNTVFLQTIWNDTFTSLFYLLIGYFILFLAFGLILSYYTAKRKFSDIKIYEKEKRQTELIQSRNLLLKQQRNELSDFAHTMNHDIRNFLAIIRQNILLTDDKTSLFSKISIDLDKIEILLNHSLKLADSGLVIDEKKEVLISKLILDLKMTFQEVQFEVKGTFPILLGDEEKIYQMLTNIVSNNIIHGKASIIYFEGEYSGDKKYFVIKIKNNGEPIAETVAEKIFTKGFTTKKDGNGLGLYIAQKIANSHGWSINLIDSINVTFAITLPVIDIRN